MALLRRRHEPATPVAEPDTVRIRDARPRERVTVGGVVTRMRARPTSGLPSLAVTITDDTGSVTAVWTGRRAIGGVTLGRRLTIEGVATMAGDRLEFTNPTYTLLP